MTFAPKEVGSAVARRLPSMGNLGRWRPLLWLAAAQLLSGVLIGLIWLQWAPTTIAYVVPGEANTTFLIPDEVESQFAGDGRFGVLCALVGIVAGVVAWRFKSNRGPFAVMTLAAAGVLSSILARWMGSQFASGSTTGALGTAIHPPLSLHSISMLWVQSFMAVLAYTALAGLSNDFTLGVTEHNHVEDRGRHRGQGRQGRQGRQGQHGASTRS
jgi:uncharacterized membrane protein YeaQ/YmgE (transglycosylase-associated protein family)